MAWLKLLRIANLPTALSNILVGYLLANGSWQPAGELGLLLVASALLYSGGMVLNDVFDFSRDSIERPQRPLPSGAIQVSTAKRVGVAMLLGGVAVGLIAGAISAGAMGATVTGLIAVALAVLIWLYDGALKQTAAAPWLMGGCRALNILLGASTAGPILFRPTTDAVDISIVQDLQTTGMGVPNLAIWYAVGIGVLIAGTTLLARREANARQSRFGIVAAIAIIAVGLVLIATTVFCPDPGFPIDDRTRQLFPWFVAVLAITIVRRLLLAASNATPRSVQSAVVAILRSLILFDACACLIVSGSDWFYPVVVAALLIPTLLLGRVVRMT